MPRARGSGKGASGEGQRVALELCRIAGLAEDKARDWLTLLTALGQRLDARARGRAGSVRQAAIENLLQIRDKQGKLRALEPNRAQREYEARAGRQNIVLKARQLGITTWIAARFFIAAITRPGTVTVQVAHDLSAAQQIFRIVHRFLANLPEEMRKGALETSRANVRQLVFTRLDSEYRVETAADREAGRGLTIANLHASEVARWSGDAAETLAGLRAAVVPGGEVVLESTPNGAAGCFYSEWQRAEETGTVRHFFPWWYEEGYRRETPPLRDLSDDERELKSAHALDDMQVAFRRELRANYGALARQEFAEDAASCFLASGECMFDADVLTARLAECTAPAEERDRGRLRVWLPAQRGAEYVIGVDAAGGGADGDYACAQVVERATGLQCAELHGHLTPAELAVKLVPLAREYNRALVAVERNNHGHGVLARLENVPGIALYEHDGQPGWPTNAVTRPRMVAQFVALVDTEPELFASEWLLQECRTFVRRGDGSGQAASGAHDDRVMAMAIAQAVRQEPYRRSRSGKAREAVVPNGHCRG